MTYQDFSPDSQPDIYPPRRPLPPRRNWLGIPRRHDQAIFEQKMDEYRYNTQVYQQKLYERHQREMKQAQNEQERMNRQHRAEQVKVAEQQAKLDEAIASAKHAQDRLNQLNAEKERYRNEPQKTSPVFGQLQKQLNDAKAKATKTRVDVENRYRQIKPLLDRLRVPSERMAQLDAERKAGKEGGEPQYGPPSATVPSSFPAATDYQANLERALELDRGVPKGTPEKKAMPSFPELSSAARAAQENIGAKEMSIAAKQEQMERSRQAAQLAAQKELEDAQAKQQAAQQVIGAYKNEGQEPVQAQAPQGVSGGNDPQGQGQPLSIPVFPSMQPRLGMLQNGVNAGSKGAIPIPIIGPILSAMAGGKGAGGMMGRPGQQMPSQGFPREANVPIPPSRPQELAGGVPIPPARPDQPVTPGVQKATYEGEPYTFATPGGPQSAVGYGGPRAADRRPQPPLFTQWQGANPTASGPAGSAVQQIIGDVSEWNRSHPQQQLDPRLPLGLARYEGGFDRSGNVPASSYKHWDKGAFSRGAYQLRDIGLGSGFAQRFGLPTPANVHQQDQYVFPYLARGQLKPWSAVRNQGLPAIYAAGGNLLKQFGGGGTQMAAMPKPQEPQRGGNAETAPPPQVSQQPQQQPQKQQNPLAAGLSAIHPAKPTIELSESSGDIQTPPLVPHQFQALPFPAEKATSMDHFAQAGLMSGLSRKQVADLLKKTMPNDQVPEWLTQQQQQEQGENAEQ